MAEAFPHGNLWRTYSATVCAVGRAKPSELGDEFTKPMQLDPSAHRSDRPRFVTGARRSNTLDCGAEAFRRLRSGQSAAAEENTERRGQSAPSVGPPADLASKVYPPQLKRLWRPTKRRAEDHQFIVSVRSRMNRRSLICAPPVTSGSRSLGGALQ
jgi:hypothetical protein